MINLFIHNKSQWKVLIDLAEEMLTKVFHKHPSSHEKVTASARKKKDLPSTAQNTR